MTVKKRRIILAILLITGFMALEIPGIFFLCGKTYPFVLGLPFLYGYIFICWFYMCMVLLCGYKTSWGRKPLFFKK